MSRRTQLPSRLKPDAAHFKANFNVIRNYFYYTHLTPFEIKARKICVNEISLLQNSASQLNKVLFGDSGEKLYTNFWGGGAGGGRELKKYFNEFGIARYRIVNCVRISTPE
jgi:hypothetical protein